MSAEIPMGYIHLARKMLESEIMKKPPLYIKLWVWMLLQASHKDHGDLKRGQFFTNVSRMREAMTHWIGFRPNPPSPKQIRSIYEFLRTEAMIDVMKVTHGMLITILNYDYYQDPKNYVGHNDGHSEGPDEGTISTKNGTKKGTKPREEVLDEIALLREPYDKGLIDQTFDAIASTRKSGKVADTVLLAQLHLWKRYPAEQVEAGIKIYLDKDYASEGKDEKYLLGIIRNQEGRTMKPERYVPVSNQPALLNDFMNNPDQYQIGGEC